MVETVKLRPWHDMTPRQQAVWAASFATTHARGCALAECLGTAERSVLALRDAEIDEGPLPPESELARANVGIDLDAFIPWYRVAAAAAFGHRPDFKAPTHEQCVAAFDRYQRSRADYF